MIGRRRRGSPVWPTWPLACLVVGAFVGCSFDASQLRVPAQRDTAGPTEAGTTETHEAAPADGPLLPAERAPEVSWVDGADVAGDAPALDLPQVPEVIDASATDEPVADGPAEPGGEASDDGAPDVPNGTDVIVDVPIDNGSDVIASGGVTGTGGIPSTGGTGGIAGPGAGGGAGGAGGSGGTSQLDGGPDAEPANTFHEYPIPFANAQPWVLTVGPDGNLWIADHSNGKILRFTVADATFKEFTAAPSNTTIEGIALGSDDALWFTERSADKIGRMTTAGVVSEYPVTANSYVLAIVAGPDGKLWFTEFSNNAIGSITTTGTVSEYAQPYSQPARLAVGADGKVWFDFYGANRVAYFMPATPASVTSFSINTTARGPAGIAVASDGAAWFYETTGNNIGRMTSTGAVAEYPIPTADSAGGSRAAMAVGPDGNLWFTEFGAGQIGRATLSGAIKEFPIPTASSGPYGIVSGPGGKLWFVESTANKLASITP
jgi:virginiamycin B lyase